MYPNLTTRRQISWSSDSALAPAASQTPGRVPIIEWVSSKQMSKYYKVQKNKENNRKAILHLIIKDTLVIYFAYYYLLLILF